MNLCIHNKSLVFKALMFGLAFISITSETKAETYRLERATAIEAGGLYVFEQTYSGISCVMSNTISNDALQTTKTYKTTGLEGTEAYVWTVEKASKGFYLKNISKGKYLNSSSTDVSLDSRSSVWAFNFQDDQTVLIQNTSNSNRFLGFPHSGGTVTYAYKAYSPSVLNTYPHAIVVYKLVAEGSSPAINGDVNNDDKVTIADVTALVNIILGKESEETYNHEAANVNGDESITIADVTALVNIILGKE